MKKCLVTLSGVSPVRTGEFAEAFMERLKGENVVLKGTEEFLISPEKDIYDTSSYDHTAIGAAYTGQPKGTMTILHGPVASAIFKKKVSCRIDIFIDTDPLDFAILEVERSLRLLQSLEEGDADEQGRDASINADASSFNEQLERDIFPQKDTADIVVHYSESAKDSVYGLVRYIKRTASDVKAAPKEEVDEMLNRFSKGGSGKRSYTFKRFIWRAVIRSTLFFKRLIDILASFMALLLLSPLFLVVGAIIKFTDGGNVFYFQQRVGKQGKIFSFPKFRSMVANADKMKDLLLQQSEREGDVTFKMKKDPRVTAIGRFIRRFSIDELPQLWCVLKGDMSLVGPRPPLPREVALYTQEDRRRLEVIPGLTGIWQVSGRADIGFEDQVKLDVLYIESHSIWLDIKLLFLTIPAVLTGKGAY